MHLRKLAWAVPLLFAVSTAQADSSGSFLDGARLASLANPAATSPAGSTHHGSSAQPDAKAPVVASVSSALAAADTPEPAAGTPEVRSLLTLVVALALVGWIQRRRQDA